MEERMNALLVHQADNVCTAIQELRDDETAFFLSEQGVEQVKVRQTPIYHKFARVPIPKCGEVVKYGEVIGFATTDIPEGTHVHTQNMISSGYKSQGGV